MISVPRRVRSASGTAVNFSPIPVAGFRWRTTASALICPSWTRKSILVVAPTGRGVAVSINSPPTLRLRTRDRSSRPLLRQQTATPPVASTREVRLREKEGLLRKGSIGHPKDRLPRLEVGSRTSIALLGNVLRRFAGSKPKGGVLVGGVPRLPRRSRGAPDGSMGRVAPFVRFFASRSSLPGHPGCFYKSKELSSNLWHLHHLEASAN